MPYYKLRSNKGALSKSAIQARFTAKKYYGICQQYSKVDDSLTTNYQNRLEQQLKKCRPQDFCEINQDWYDSKERKSDSGVYVKVVDNKITQITTKSLQFESTITFPSEQNRQNSSTLSVFNSAMGRGYKTWIEIMEDNDNSDNNNNNQDPNTYYLISHDAIKVAQKKMSIDMSKELTTEVNSNIFSVLQALPSIECNKMKMTKNGYDKNPYIARMLEESQLLIKVNDNDRIVEYKGSDRVPIKLKSPLPFKRSHNKTTPENAIFEQTGDPEDHIAGGKLSSVNSTFFYTPKVSDYDKNIHNANEQVTIEKNNNQLFGL